METGDFSELATDYARYRPSYNKNVIQEILESVRKKPNTIKVADVGAGTGIFTKCLWDAGVTDLVAVEPNYNMRRAGEKFLDKDVKILRGSAEKTGLEGQSFDLVTMASAFHWSKTAHALTEFGRILLPNGVFSAIWNPRLTERSVPESEIQKLLEQKYKIVSRVSSGLSGITEKIEGLVMESGIFDSVIYVDSIDVVQRSHPEYIGAWRTVNDVQSQLGKDKFGEFIEDVEKIIAKTVYVEVHYLTRAWIARKSI